jgi:endoglucanase
MIFNYKTIVILLLIISLCPAAGLGWMTEEPDSLAPDSTDMRNLKSTEIIKEMIPGWNVGNSLEAIGGETAWGNPMIDQQLIDSVKVAGFNTVRIPVAWSRFSDEENFIIQEEWLDRVEEVVWYVLSNDMYAIINEHWDGGWQQPTYADSAYVNQRLSAMWKQIAIRFRDYDDHLLFAGTNEIMKEGDWGTPKKEYYTVQNSFNQTFISTVRATGGRNTYRHLIIQGFNTNIDHTVNYLTLPKDSTPNRMMVEVHYYDPYNFTLNENSNLYVWGQQAAGSESWANESWADSQFRKMKQKFIDKGYAVVLGEYGVMSRTDLGSEEKNQSFAEYRRYYINYVTAAMVKNEILPVLWDNGFTGNHGMGVFNRSTGEQFDPVIINAVIEGANQEVTTVGIDENHRSSRVPEKFDLQQNYPNPFNPTTTIAYNLPKSGEVTLKVFDLKGNEIAVLENRQFHSAGHYHIHFNAAGLVSGMYFYRLVAGDFWQTKKMLLLK